MIQLQETMVRRSTANTSEHPANATRCYSERALDSKMKYSVSSTMLDPTTEQLASAMGIERLYAEMV